MTTTRRRVESAHTQACSRCPWRIANQGKRHPGGWYTKRNLERLWAGLRRGEDMTCHPTDPDNPVEAEWVERGAVRPVGEGAVTHECTGALILKQREFMRLQGILENGGTYADYKRQYPRGLTRRGAAALLERVMFVLPGERPMSRPNLADADVGAPFLERSA